MFVLVSGPAQKGETIAIFKPNYTLKLFVTFKMAYSCCFSSGGNLDFPDFLPKKFYNINYFWEPFFFRRLIQFFENEQTVVVVAVIVVVVVVLF